MSFDIENLLTKENITFILSIIGSVGAVSGWLFSYIRNRKNIEFEITESGISERRVVAYFKFQNKSRLPISITNISILYGGKTYPAYPIEKYVGDWKKTSKGTMVAQKIYYSTPIPIYLPQLGATSGYILFLIPKEKIPETSTHLNFEVCTNRGSAIQKRLLINQIPPDHH